VNLYSIYVILYMAIFMAIFIYGYINLAKAFMASYRSFHKIDDLLKLHCLTNIKTKNLLPLLDKRPLQDHRLSSVQDVYEVYSTDEL